MGKNNACWPWSHQWSKWSDISNVEKKRTFDGQTVNSGIIQEKRCEKCNKVEVRIAWAR